MSEYVHPSTMRAIRKAADNDPRVHSVADWSDVVVVYVGDGYVYPNDNYGGHPMSTFDARSARQFREELQLVVPGESYHHVCGPRCG